MRPALVATLLAIATLCAHAETFQVTRTDDPMPDACLSGDCSFREAMDAAAQNDPFGEVDTILLPAGTYTLIRGPLPFVYQGLRVHGAGPEQTLVAHDPEHMGLLEVRQGGDLALDGLRLESSAGQVGGNVNSRMSLHDVIAERGLYIAAESVAEIRHSELRDDLRNYGELLVEDSMIFNLYQLTPQAGDPETTLRRVLVDNALYPGAPQTSTITVHAGAVTIEDSTITGSEVRLVNGAVSLNLHRVRYLDNAGPVRSLNAAQVTIEDSLFEGNLVRALYAAGGAEWNVSGSSFLNNRVDGNAGGAIVLEDSAMLRIRNSTFSGNTVTAAAASAGARGAAIGYRNGAGAQLILSHVTIVAPAVMPVGLVGSAIGGHGGGTTLDLSNSIVRGSCGLTAGVLWNNAGNIEAPGNTCGLDPQGNHVSVASASLALGALGNHGGRTPTYLPGAGSFAINRASTPQCLPFDQRGLARPGGVGCDVGAVEADADDTLFADGFEP